MKELENPAVQVTQGYEKQIDLVNLAVVKDYLYNVKSYVKNWYLPILQLFSMSEKQQKKH